MATVTDKLYVVQITLHDGSTLTCVDKSLEERYGSQALAGFKSGKYLTCIVEDDSGDEAVLQTWLVPYRAVIKVYTTVVECEREFVDDNCIEQESE